MIRLTDQDHDILLVNPDHIVSVHEDNIDSEDCRRVVLDSGMLVYCTETIEEIETLILAATKP